MPSYYFRKPVTIASFTALISISCLTNCTDTGDQENTEAKAQGQDAREVKWVNLLEGDSLSQWKRWRKKGKIEEATDWTFNDGVLHLNKAAIISINGGSITTIKPYQNFEFKFEFKISKAGNSGVKYRSLDNLGFEYQILDDESAKDNKNPLNSAASLYQLVAAPTTKKLNPVGEWNTGKIIANGNHIEHWLNGEQVVSLEYGSEDWKKRFAASKYKKEPNFSKQGGEILLQDHGDDVWFRNLLIREL